MKATSFQPTGITMMVLIVVLFTPWTASAGIPEPGLFIYGKVYNDSNVLVTTGTMDWTFTPADASSGPVVISTELAEIPGDGGPYSYRVTIPLESAVTGIPVTNTAVGLTDQNVLYNREVSVNSVVALVDQINISAGTTRGSAQRIDICASGCDINHSGDFLTGTGFANLNPDGAFSSLELLRMLQIFNATETHDYHCAPGNPAEPDGFAAGTGDQNCLPHSADWLFQNRRIDSLELLRILQLFNATDLPVHPYCAQPSLNANTPAEDGFRPGSCITVLREAPEPDWAGVGYVLYRKVTAEPAESGFYVNISIQVTQQDPIPVTALLLIEQFPEGWQYQGLASGASLPIEPLSGAGGEVTFGWTSPPPAGENFTYRVFVPNTPGWASDVASLIGDSAERVGKKAGHTLIPVYLNENGGGTDTDGDGIPDSYENIFGDLDGDGIPDFLDPNSSPATSLPLQAGFVLLALPLMVGSGYLIWRRRSVRGIEQSKLG